MSLPNNIVATEMEQLYALYSIQSILQQIYDNLAFIREGTSGQQVTVANVSLFYLAAFYYGDATAWTVIAEANNLIDPMITSTITIVIPTTFVSNGGILNAPF